ncbi:MAG: RNA-binding domain-containing protein [Halobacteriales archaeon]
MIHRVAVQITTPLYPTEVRDRVEDAVHNLFPGAEIEERHGELVAEAHSLSRLAERVDEQNIGPTAHEIFLANRDGEAFSFDLKKAAAFEGVVNFAVGNPDELGDIHVRVRVDQPNVDTLIDYLASQEGENDGSTVG